MEHVQTSNSTCTASMEVEAKYLYVHLVRKRKKKMREVAKNEAISLATGEKETCPCLVAVLLYSSAEHPPKCIVG